MCCSPVHAGCHASPCRPAESSMNLPPVGSATDCLKAGCRQPIALCSARACAAASSALCGPHALACTRVRRLTWIQPSPDSSGVRATRHASGTFAISSVRSARAWACGESLLHYWSSGASGPKGRAKPSPKAASHGCTLRKGCYDWVRDCCMATVMQGIMLQCNVARLVTEEPSHGQKESCGRWRGIPAY
jgi:hypothetical protein